MADWPALIWTGITGSAAGSIITAAVSWYRNRLQPVGFTIKRMGSTTGVPTAGDAKMSTQTTVEVNGIKTDYPTLTMLSVNLQNTGYTDIPEFSLGLIFPYSHKVVWTSGHGPNHQNVVQVLTPCAPKAERREVDFKMTPFNRGVPFWVSLWVFHENYGEIEDPTLVSKNPVRFVRGITPRQRLGVFWRASKDWISRKVFRRKKKVSRPVGPFDWF